MLAASYKHVVVQPLPFQTLGIGNWSKQRIFLPSYSSQFVSRLIDPKAKQSNMFRCKLRLTTLCCALKAMTVDQKLPAWKRLHTTNESKKQSLNSPLQLLYTLVT
jgi:hypothetical protein